MPPDKEKPKRNTDKFSVPMFAVSHLYPVSCIEHSKSLYIMSTQVPQIDKVEKKLKKS